MKTFDAVPRHDVITHEHRIVVILCERLIFQEAVRDQGSHFDVRLMPPEIGFGHNTQWFRRGRSEYRWRHRDQYRYTSGKRALARDAPRHFEYTSDSTSSDLATASESVLTKSLRYKAFPTEFVQASEVIAQHGPRG